MEPAALACREAAGPVVPACGNRVVCRAEVVEVDPAAEAGRAVASELEVAVVPAVQVAVDLEVVEAGQEPAAALQRQAQKALRRENG